MRGLVFSGLPKRTSRGINGGSFAAAAPAHPRANTPTASPRQLALIVRLLWAVRVPQREPPRLSDGLGILANTRPKGRERPEMPAGRCSPRPPRPNQGKPKDVVALPPSASPPIAKERAWPRGHPGGYVTRF